MATSDASPSGSGITAYLLYLVAASTLGALQFGYHLAELNAPAGVLQCKVPVGPSNPDVNHSILPRCIPMDASEFAVVTSIYTLGGLLGALGAGPIATKSGRVLPMRLTAPLFMLGSLLEAVAPSLAVITTGRFIAGLGAGAAIVVGPIYIAEVSPPGARGALGALTQVVINVGIVLAQVLGYFLSYGGMWRIVLGVASGLGLLQLLVLLFAAESPEWLAKNGKQAQARKTLMRIRGSVVDADEVDRIESDDTEADDESQSLLPTPVAPAPASGMSPATKKAQNNVGILEVVQDPMYRPAIIAVVAVMLAQQFTGINSVIMYSVTFLSELLPTGAALITVLLGVLNLIVTLACSPLADKLGRKPCLLLSIAGMTSMSLLIGIGIQEGFKVVTAVATLFFTASFAVGLGPVPFILASELVGPEAVGATQSWALAANWISTFVVAQLFPILNAALPRGRVFYMFTGAGLFFLLFIAYWVPETKGKRNADEVWGRQRRED